VTAFQVDHIDQPPAMAWRRMSYLQGDFTIEDVQSLREPPGEAGQHRRHSRQLSFLPRRL